jgi:gamma-glutamyltranspeptidase/glutathione hydrolase
MLRILAFGLAATSVWAAHPVRARHAMVVSRETHATHVGLEVLKGGGNAVDAAVAVGFALAVTHPSAGNIGGGGFLLLRTAGGQATFIDFRERAPEKASRNMYLDAAGNATRESIEGYRASGVPGTVRGLEYASKKYGRKPWAELVRPAVELAAKGFPLSYLQAQSIGGSKLLARNAESKRVFQRDGRPCEAGERFLQPELAATLERIAKLGAADFYEGETARRLAADMAAHGGLITLDDLRGYTVAERRPLTGTYKGCTIVTAPPPSSGGAGILQMMGLLEGTGYEKSGAGSAASLHWMAEAMRRYFADRAEHMGDPDFVTVPLTRLLAPAYIAGLRGLIDPARATPSAQVRAFKLVPGEGNETTHFSVADAEGNVVALTYTLNSGYGSGVTAAGLGFLLNNEMDDFAPKPGSTNNYGLIQGENNAIQARKRPLSCMTPTIVVRDGKPYLAVGSPGGPTIINTVLQVILNVLDFGMNVQDAVNQPRIHHQWMPDELRLERGFSPDTAAALAGRGHQVKRVASQGEVAAILFDGGWLQGAPDPRTECTAEGY